MKKVLVHHPGKELELANTDPVEHHFDQPVDIKRFKADHRSMMNALAEAGIDVFDVGTLLKYDPKISAQVERCPNLVFTRDSSFVTDAGAVLMRMGLPSRRRETPVIEAAHEALGVSVGLHLEEPETFEGGGFALLDDKVAVAGLCQRTTKGALDKIRSFLFEKGVVDRFVVLNVPPRRHPHRRRLRRAPREDRPGARRDSRVCPRKILHPGGVVGGFLHRVAQGGRLGPSGDNRPGEE